VKKAQCRKGKGKWRRGKPKKKKHQDFIHPKNDQKTDSAAYILKEQGKKKNEKKSQTSKDQRRPSFKYAQLFNNTKGKKKQKKLRLKECWGTGRTVPQPMLWRPVQHSFTRGSFGARKVNRLANMSGVSHETSGGDS